jgi:hypothetical protein
LRRITLAYFCLSALDLLESLPNERKDLIEWVYSLQCLDTSTGMGGFRGSLFAACPSVIPYPNDHKQHHVTY